MLTKELTRHDNPLSNKFVTFLGKPLSLTSTEAKHELSLVGGFYTRSITSNLDYVVAFSGAENRVLFSEVRELADKKMLKIISEDEFLEMLSR
jgi:NAD-dependent DNA ligase